MAAKKSMFNIDYPFNKSKKAFDILLNSVPTSKKNNKSAYTAFNGPGSNVLNQFNLKKFGGKNDVDFDGVLNKFDCNPFNTMEQDFSPFRDQSKADQFTAAKRFGGQNLQGLKRIGSGRDRTVYALDKDKVLKVAKNPGGLTQNTSESDLNWLGLGEEIETGKDYVVAKRNQPLSAQGRQKLAMVRAEVDKVPHIVGAHQSRRLSTLKGNLSTEDGALAKAGITDDVLNYDFYPEELFANRQWGEDEEGNLKLNDGGALQSGDSISKYRVKDFKHDDWQSDEWRQVQNQRAMYRNKGNYKPESDIYSRNKSLQSTPMYAPQTVWHAGNVPPSQRINEEGKVYGFSSKEQADNWQQKHNKANVYQFVTDNYNVDTRTYSPRKNNTPNDNEYVVGSIIKEELVEDTLEFPGIHLTGAQRVALTSYMFLNESNDNRPYTFRVVNKRDGMITMEATSKTDGSKYTYEIAESEL